MAKMRCRSCGDMRDRLYMVFQDGVKLFVCASCEFKIGMAELRQADAD